jgi:hypothetical protein
MPLYITEYQSLARANNGPFVSAGQEPNVAEQQVAISGSSTQSAAFNAKTGFVMIHTDAICALAFGDNPTAANNRHRMAAGEVRFYGVSPGQKVAVITAT